MGSEAAPWVAPGKLSSRGTTHFLLEGPEDGELVAFIHGIGTYSFYFDGFAAFLRSQGYRTLRFDNLGMGFSQLPDVDAEGEADADVWRGQGHVEQLRTLLAELQLLSRRVHIVGHSMGGAIATLYAHKYPADVSSLTLLSPAGLLSPWAAPTTAKTAILRALPECLLPGILSGLVSDSRNIDRLRGFGDFADPNHPENERVAQVLLRMHTNNPNAIKALFSCARFFPLWGCHAAASAVGAGPVPVLVLHGAADKTIPPRPTLDIWRKAMLQSSGLGLGLGLSRAEEVPGAHAFFLEHAEDNHARVAAFLSAVRAAEEAVAAAGSETRLPAGTK